MSEPPLQILQLEKDRKCFNQLVGMSVSRLRLNVDLGCTKHDIYISISALACSCIFECMFMHVRHVYSCTNRQVHECS